MGEQQRQASRKSPRRSGEGDRARRVQRYNASGRATAEALRGRVLSREGARLVSEMSGMVRVSASYSIDPSSTRYSVCIADSIVVSQTNGRARGSAASRSDGRPDLGRGCVGSRQPSVRRGTAGAVHNHFLVNVKRFINMTNMNRSFVQYKYHPSQICQKKRV